MKKLFCDLGLHLWGHYHFLTDTIHCDLCDQRYPCERRWHYEQDHHIRAGELDTLALPYRCPGAQHDPTSRRQDLPPMRLHSLPPPPHRHHRRPPDGSHHQRMPATPRRELPCRICRGHRRNGPGPAGHRPRRLLEPPMTRPSNKPTIAGMITTGPGPLAGDILDTIHEAYARLGQPDPRRVVRIEAGPDALAAITAVCARPEPPTWRVDPPDALLGVPLVPSAKLAPDEWRAIAADSSTIHQGKATP